MSGGSWDYVYRRFEDVGERLIAERDPIRQALGRKILKIAKAMHDIEWVDSDDYGPGDEQDAMHECLSKIDILESIAREAINTAERLKTAMLQAGTYPK